MVFDYHPEQVSSYHEWEPYGTFYNITSFYNTSYYGVQRTLTSGWEVGTSTTVYDNSTPTKVSYRWYTRPAKANTVASDTIITNYARTGFIEGLAWQHVYYDKYSGSWFVFSLINESGQFYLYLDEVLSTINTSTGLNYSIALSKAAVDLASYDKSLFKPKYTYSEDGKTLGLCFINSSGIGDIYSLNKVLVPSTRYDVDENGAIIFVDNGTISSTLEIKKLDITGTTVISPKPIEYFNGKYDVDILSLDVFHNRPYLIVGASINPFNHVADKPAQLSILEYQP
jgi:hypothetical protein